MNNFQKLYEVDYQPLLEDIVRNKELFGSIPVRTNFETSPHREVADILLRGPQIDSESTLEDLYHTIPCQWYKPSESFSDVLDAIHELMYIVQGVQLGRVIITKLPAGGQIYEHSDEGDAAKFYSRYHIVANGQHGSMFYCGEEQVEMLSGEVWWFNSNIEHSVKNDSEYDRIHIVCDIRVE